MKTLSIFSRILILFSLSIPLFASGQTLEVMKSPCNYKIKSKSIGNILYVLDQSQKLWAFNLISKSSELISNNIRQADFSDSGVYFIKNESNNNIKFLYYHQPGQTAVNSIQISDSTLYNQREISIYKNTAVVGGYLNKKYKVFEFNGASNTAQSSSGSLYPMIDVFKLNGEIAGVYIENGYTIVRDKDQVQKFKYDTKQKWNRILSTEQTILFTANNRAFVAHDLNKFDINILGNFNDVYFLESSLSPQGRGFTDSFIFGIKQVNTRYPEFTYSLSLYSPYELKEVPIPESFKQPIFSHISGNGFHHVVWNYEHGFELARLKPGDTLKAINEINKGRGSSLTSLTQIYNIKDTLYFLATNGSGKNHLYRIIDNQSESLFPINGLSGIAGHFNGELYWFNFNNDSIYINKRNLSSLEPEPKGKPFKISKNGIEWHRNVYFNYLNTPYESWQYYLQNGNVITDKKGNVIFSSLFTTPEGGENTMIAHSDTDHTSKCYGSPLIVKYNSNGDLLWYNSIAGSNNLFVYNQQISLDDDGNVYIASTCFDSARFGPFQSPYPRSATYICKLNKDNGHVEWVKFTNPTYYTNTVEITALEVKGSNIYVGINCGGMEYVAFGEWLSNNTYPFPIIMKLDTAGNHLFSKVVPSELPKVINYVQAIKHAPESNDVYVLVSQGEYNAQATCEYYGFQNKIMRMNRNGEFLSHKTFGGSDINLADQLLITPYNQLFTAGYFRGSFQSGKFSLSSDYDNKSMCHKNVGYWSKFQLMSGNIIPGGLHSFNVKEFYPFDISMDDRNIYVFGVEYSDKSWQTCIKKMDHFGKLLASKNLPFNLGSPLGNTIQPKFTVTDSFFYLSAGQVTRVAPYNNYPVNKAYCSFFKMDKFSGWEKIDDEFEAEYESGELIVSPNPASDYIQLKFAEGQYFKSWELIDAQGRKVANGEFDSESLHTINLQYIAPGCYTLLLGGNGSKYIKIVVQ
ncbi:MAG TPA: T9SS type A sorting domain-containing protein, partial [Bacteroidia bacterium]